MTFLKKEHQIQQKFIFEEIQHHGYNLRNLYGFIHNKSAVRLLPFDLSTFGTKTSKDNKVTIFEAIFS